MKTLSRQAFLTFATRLALAAGGLLTGAGLLRFLSYAPAVASPAELDLGPGSDYPSGSTTYLRQANALILHTSEGYFALSTICPHLGCEVNAVGSEYHCPCHGSRFDSQGNRLQGPASQSLHKLRVELNEAGHLILYAQTNLLAISP